MIHDTKRFDILNNHWEELDSFSEGISSIQADIWLDDVIYMIGGQTATGESSSIQTYDPVDGNSNKWIEPTRSESGKGIAQCVYNSDTLIAIGGAMEEARGGGGGAKRRMILQGGGGGDTSSTYFESFTILGGMFGIFVFFVVVVVTNQRDLYTTPL